MNEVTNSIEKIHQATENLHDLINQLDQAQRKQEIIALTESDPERFRMVRAAAGKTIREVYQYDGFHVGVNSADSFMIPDNDGDCLMGGPRDELRHSDEALAVRIHIPKKANKEMVLRLLTKLRAWVEREFENNHTLIDEKEVEF